MKNSIHSADADIYILTKERFNDPVYKNQCIGEGNGAWIMFIQEDDVPKSAVEADILQIAEELAGSGQADIYVLSGAALEACAKQNGNDARNMSDMLCSSVYADGMQNRYADISFLNSGVQILSLYDEKICAPKSMEVIVTHCACVCAFSSPLLKNKLSDLFDLLCPQ